MRVKFDTKFVWRLWKLGAATQHSPGAHAGSSELSIYSSLAASRRPWVNNPWFHCWLVITKRYGQSSRSNKASPKSTAKTAVLWLFSISQPYDPTFGIHPLLQCSVVYLADKEIYRRSSGSKKTAKNRTRMTAAKGKGEGRTSEYGMQKKGHGVW